MIASSDAQRRLGPGPRRSARGRSARPYQGRARDAIQRLERDTGLIRRRTAERHRPLRAGGRVSHPADQHEATRTGFEQERAKALRKLIDLRVDAVAIVTVVPVLVYLTLRFHDAEQCWPSEPARSALSSASSSTGSARGRVAPRTSPSCSLAAFLHVPSTMEPVAFGGLLAYEEGYAPGELRGRAGLAILESTVSTVTSVAFGPHDPKVLASASGDGADPALGRPCAFGARPCGRSSCGVQPGLHADREGAGVGQLERHRAAPDVFFTRRSLGRRCRYSEPACSASPSVRTAMSSPAASVSGEIAEIWRVR